MPIREKDIKINEPYMLRTVYSKSKGYRYYMMKDNKWVRVSKKLVDYLHNFQELEYEATIYKQKCEEITRCICVRFLFKAISKYRESPKCNNFDFITNSTNIDFQIGVRVWQIRFTLMQKMEIQTA